MAVATNPSTVAAGYTSRSLLLLDLTQEMDEGRRNILLVNDTDTTVKIIFDIGEHIYLYPRSALNKLLWRIRAVFVQYPWNEPEFDIYVSDDIDLCDNRGIIFYKTANNNDYAFPTFDYAFQTFQSLISKDMNRLVPQWVSEKFCWTRFVNMTDSEIEIGHSCDVYTLKPNDADVVYWLDSATFAYYPLRIWVDGIELCPNYSVPDFSNNTEITIFRGVDNACSLQLLSCEDLRETVKETMSSVQKLLHRMEKLLKRVTIWHKACQNLLHRYRQLVGVMRQVLSAGHLGENWCVTKFICSKVICCMLEGQELLQFCGGNDYNKAAFALSSPRSPSAPTLSRFLLVFSELDWTLVCICFVEHEKSWIIDWKWCEKSCRLKYDKLKSDKRDKRDLILSLDFLETMFSKVDGQFDDQEAFLINQEAFLVDREAFQASLNSKFIGNPSASNDPSVFSPLKYLGISFSFRSPYKILGGEVDQNQETLHGIWRKRLLATSKTSGPSSKPGDWFQIDKPDFEIVKHLASGAYKRVDICKWLGETVAVAVLDVPKEQADAEASLLARVQHPNVVELFGYFYLDDVRNPQGFLVTELMEQDLESLISQQSSALESGPTIERPPFAFPIAIDISLQIVEAMIHLRDCGVLHRDLKPKNCLASPKYKKDSIPSECSDIPMYYTIKLIDFGAAKMRDQDSYFHTYKQGTPYYMAPEVYGRTEKECPYTWSADVYSFGMTCFEVFTGRAPFKKWTKFGEVQEFICGGGRPSFPFELPSLVKELIERCWAQDPTDRPSFQEIRKYLWKCKVYAVSFPFDAI